MRLPVDRPLETRFVGGIGILFTTAVFTLAISAGTTSCGFPCTGDVDYGEQRFPCDGETLWDPNVPLLFNAMYTGICGADRSPAVQNNVRVFTANGKEADVVVRHIGDGRYVICPLGGLEPDTEYFWKVGPFETDSNNTVTPSFNDNSVHSFTTDGQSDNQPITTAAACAGVKASVYELLSCGDTGDWDSGETD